MEHEDQRLEALLRQFQPRAPRALPSMTARTPAADRTHGEAWLERAPAGRAGAWVALGATVVIAVFAANLRFMPMAAVLPQPGIGPGLTVQDMRRLIDADPATLDRALLEASRHTLPDVEAPGSTLRLLAQP